MTNREQAKMTMYAGADTFLTDNAAVYAANVAFTTEKATFDAAYTAVKNAAAKTGTDNSGFSTDKNDAKDKMSLKAAVLSGFAFVRMEDLNNAEVAEQLHTALTDYTSLSDADCASRSQAAHDLMLANTALLAPDYVRAADLGALQTLITDFLGAQGSSDAAHQTEPQDTTAFKEAIRTIDKSIVHLLLLGRFYIESNTEFYNDLVLVCEIPAVNVHHTNVNVTVTKSENGQPIVNATGVLSNSDKTGTSDLNGVMNIEQVRSGDAVLTVSAPGRQQVAMPIDIERGTDNNFNVAMELI